MSDDYQQEAQKADTRDKLTTTGAAIAKAAIVGAGAVSSTVIGATTGLLPVIGASLATELLNVVIPNFKQERYEKFVNEIERRVEALEGESCARAQSRQHSAEFADLYEDGARQAVRALSNERIAQIATLLENSLTSEEMDHLRRKRLLELLGQINDIEMLLLQGEALEPPDDREFWKKHQDIFPEPVHFGASQDMIDANAIFKQYRQHLVDLGLMKKRYQKPIGNKPVEFDFDTGGIKTSGYEVTGVGRQLLYEIGLREPRRERQDRRETSSIGQQ